MNFDYFMPAKIISGKNCVKENASVISSFGNNCMIVTGGHSAKTSGALDDCISVLDSCGIAYCVFDGISPNPSSECCFNAGRIANEKKVDFLIGIGGGSALDAAKAIAIYGRNDYTLPDDIYGRKVPAAKLPVILIGTTAGTGSEVTGVSVLTNSDGRKKSISGADCYADVSFCDYTYTLSVPVAVTVSTALDAFAHAVESYLSSSSNEISELFSLKAIRMLSGYILSSCAIIPDESLREQLYTASVYAGLAINKAGTDFPHTVGYYLTENHQVPHGKACAVLMPCLLERAKKYCPEKLEAICTAMCSDCDSIANAIRKACDLNICIDKESAAAVALRWAGGVKNFDRSPGGFTYKDAEEALISI